jgi:hypothetical protein
MLQCLHRTIPCVMLFCVACTGTIQDPARYDDYGRPVGNGLPTTTIYTPGVVPQAGTGTGTATGSGRAGSSPYPATGGVLNQPASGGGGTTAAPPTTVPTSPGAVAPATVTTFDPTAPNSSGNTVGMGDITKPAIGPAPTESVGGSAFVLVKNWDFGATGTIKNINDLIGEFQFHDNFGTIANGTNYGAVTVAPTSATAVSAPNLNLPNNRQPVEDPSRPYREFTDDSIRTYVRPLNPSATSVSAGAHDTGNGSFTAKWNLAKGGSRLGKDLLWESRVRIPKPVTAFWFSLWNAGKKWNKGAEMDVVESFGTPNIGTGAKAFHVNSVGGTDKYPYKNWPNELGGIGVPAPERDLSEWHTFTWVYLRDDTFKVYYDGYVVQEGKLLWTYGGTADAEAIDMYFLFDFGWGHTQVADVNITLAASAFPLEYELDYSRVYLRN